MRARTLLAILLVALAAVGTASAAPTAPTAPSTAQVAGVARIAQLETDVLGALNQIRTQHGLVPLKLSATLSKAAAEHSVQMGQAGYFKHESADGSAFWKRIERFYPSKGESYWSVGENLLWSSPSIDAPGAMKLWMASPE